MAFSPTVLAQIQQIQMKIRERTIGSTLPADKVNEPVWAVNSLPGRPVGKGEQ